MPDREQREKRRAAITATNSRADMRRHFSEVHRASWLAAGPRRSRNDHGKFTGPAAPPLAPVPASAPRQSEQEAIAAFLAARGATRLPSVGDPALVEVSSRQPLAWDRKLRKLTRKAVAPAPVRYRRPPA